jgi:hypothetical protein
VSGEGFGSIKLVGVRWPLRGLLGGVSADGVGVHAHWILSFGMRSRLKAAQLNKNNQSTLGRPRNFTLRSGPVCFSQPKAFSTSQRLPKRQLEQIAEWLYGRALVMASSQFTIAACIAIR